MKLLGMGCYGITDAEYDTAPRELNGQWHGRHPIHFVQNRDISGNLNVPYLYENGDKVVLNWNWLDNDWNSNNPAVRFATLFISPPHSRGSFVFGVGRSSRPTFCRFRPTSPRGQYTFYYPATSLPTEPSEVLLACRLSVWPDAQTVIFLHGKENSPLRLPRLFLQKHYQFVVLANGGEFSAVSGNIGTR